MAGKIRIEYPGAIYHVMNRGDRREPIFKDDSDRLRFLETVAEACAKTDWQVQVYCLMGNHFHLSRRDAPAQSGRGHEMASGQLNPVWFVSFPSGKKPRAETGPERKTKEMNI